MQGFKCDIVDCVNRHHYVCKNVVARRGGSLSTFKRLITGRMLRARLLMQTWLSLVYIGVAGDEVKLGRGDVLFNDVWRDKGPKVEHVPSDSLYQDIKSIDELLDLVDEHGKPKEGKGEEDEKVEKDVDVNMLEKRKEGVVLKKVRLGLEERRAGSKGGQSRISIYEDGGRGRSFGGESVSTVLHRTCKLGSVLSC
jgi:hypothetical protein